MFPLRFTAFWGVGFRTTGPNAVLAHSLDTQICLLKSWNTKGSFRILSKAWEHKRQEMWWVRKGKSVTVTASSYLNNISQQLFAGRSRPPEDKSYWIWWSTDRLSALWMEWVLKQVFNVLSKMSQWLWDCLLWNLKFTSGWIWYTNNYFCCAIGTILKIKKNDN